jgi:hypothetical protein
MPITDSRGIQVGYEPIATFDLENEIEGNDPAFPQYLGSNTGLVHTYVDSNLINGLEYWYCVTSFDGGTQKADSLEQSYMYPIGSSTFEQHTVAVTPRIEANNVGAAAITEGFLEPIGGACEGTARVEIVDPDAITGHGYKIKFTVAVDGETFFTLIDTTADDTVAFEQPLSDLTGDNIPIYDGIRLHLHNSEVGVASQGWTKVDGDTSTFDWWTGPRTGHTFEIPEEMYGAGDFKIVITSTADMTTVRFTDYFSMFSEGVETTIDVPLRVYNINDPANPIDVTEYCMILDWLNSSSPITEILYGPQGWDLIPGGAGYSMPFDDMDNVQWGVDILVLGNGPTEEDSFILLKTQNGPDTAIAPREGDEYTLISNKSFHHGISYVFGTTARKVETLATTPANPLADIRVVPDPYIVTNIWEYGEFGKQLQFTGLPSECTIKIYTLAGDYVAKIKHNSMASGSSSGGQEFWDLRNRQDQFVAPGVYLFAATTPDGDSKIGRFLVIR